MLRFEIEKNKVRRYWEITLDSRWVRTTQGRTDTKKTSTEKLEWSDARTAKAEHDRQVARRMKGGWVLVADTPDEAKTKGRRNEALETKIRKNPDNAAAWLVYADWLQEQGDPRGELVVVQEAMSRKPNDRALLRAENRLFETHADAFVGTLIGRIEDVRIEDIRANRASSVEITWRNGFFGSAAVHYEAPDDLFDDAGDGSGDPAALVSEVVSHPSAIFLDRLIIETRTHGAYDDHRALVDLLCKIEPPPLRHLAIATADSPQGCTLGDVSGLLAAYPLLRSLELRGELSMRKGRAIELADLRVLRLGRIDEPILRAIAAAEWPKLERLVIGIGGASIAAITPILTARTLPKLRHLGLLGSTHGDELCRALADSARIRSLKTLDLSGGTITRRGVRLLVGKKRDLRLERIDLRGNYLDDEARADLTGIARDVVVTDQRRVGR